MSRPAPASNLSAPQIHPAQQHRRPSGGRPAPSASYSQPIHPQFAQPMAPGMNPSSSAPGSRSSRPQSQQMTSQSGHGQGMFRPDHPFLQQRGPSYQPQKPAQPARLPQPPTRGRGNSSDTTASTQTSGSSEVGSLTESTRVNIIRQQGQYVDAASPKEVLLDTPRQQFAPQVAVRDEIDVHLEHLFDTLQVPDAVRAKFSTVSPDVKSSILTSSYSSNPAILQSLGLSSTVGRAAPRGGSSGTAEKPPLRKRLSQPVLRKQKSASSIGSPGASPQVGRTYRVDGDHFTIVASPPSLASPTIAMPGSPARPGQSVRGQSIDVGRPATMRSSHSGPRPMSFALFDKSASVGKAKGAGAGLGIAVNGEQPESFIAWLRAYKATDLRMDVDKMKKLRMVLRHEKTEWVARFLELGGYGLILARLQDLLDIEWREEQHDDQMLHELIRCVKALSTSEIGKTALRSSFPRPFDSLSGLLFSEKKPGDLPIRQLIVELWTFVFELFPPPSSRSATTSPISPNAPFARAQQQQEGRPTSIRFDDDRAGQVAAMLANTGPRQGLSERVDRGQVDGQGKSVDAIQAVRGFLVPPQEDKAAEQHSFITQAHRPKVFRAWVQELSDICRDYFWIMCHANNTLWAEEEVDERLVTRPVAPGGATGGVEFEAMNYVITHFRLLNTLCFHLSQRDRRTASELHNELMMSGMDRILVTMRKASTTFYPTLHLELARYVTHLRRASPGERLPHLIDKMVGPPPEEYRRRREMSHRSSQAFQAAQVPVGQRQSYHAGADGRGR